MLNSQRHNAIRLLTLNRPEKRNSLHPKLIAELSHTLTQINLDRDTNVVIITGAGSSFCSGLDLTYLGSLDVPGKIAYLQSFFALFSQIYFSSQPVIAAVNGPAIAGGLDLAAACDLRLCSSEAKFAQPEVSLGITQMMYPIYKVIGLSRAKELALTGGPISAAEAYRIGLADHVYRAEELLPQAFKLAGTLASRPREALFATKQLSRDLIQMDTDSAIKRMLEMIIERLRSGEHKRALEQYVA